MLEKPHVFHFCLLPLNVLNVKKFKITSNKECIFSSVIYVDTKMYISFFYNIVLLYFTKKTFWVNKISAKYVFNALKHYVMCGR